jgi:hypothetical protein
MRPISITTPDSPTAIGAEERETLLEELAAAAGTNSTAAELVDLLLHAGRTFTPTDAQILILLRATDHIRRDPSRSTSSLGMLHSRLANAVNVERVVYSLVSSEGEERPTPFTSYSGEYGDGDRLVTPSGETYRVVAHGEVARGATTLIVEPWQRR